MSCSHAVATITDTLSRNSCDHLAQVWLNHRPLSLEPLPASTAKQLSPALPAVSFSLRHRVSLPVAADSTYEPKTFFFGPTGSETQLTLPLPCAMADDREGGESLSIRCMRSAELGPVIFLSEPSCLSAATLAR